MFRYLFKKKKKTTDMRHGRLWYHAIENPKRVSRAVVEHIFAALPGGDENPECAVASSSITPMPGYSENSELDVPKGAKRKPRGLKVRELVDVVR